MEVDRSDPIFSETCQSTLAETVFSRLILYFDDPFIKLRPILLGKKQRKYSILFFNGFTFSISFHFFHFSFYILPSFSDSLAMLAKKHPVAFEKEINKLPINYLYNNEIAELRKRRYETAK